MRDSFPFRYDYDNNVRKMIDRIILSNYAALTHIQHRYRKTIPAKKCAVRYISIGLLLS